VRLVHEARHLLIRKGSPRRVEDENDVANSVFRRLCAMATDDRLDGIDQGEALWALLMKITAGKVVDSIRRQAARKRGGGDVRGESVFDDVESERADAGLQDFAADDLTAESKAAFDEELGRSLKVLPDDTRAVVESFLRGNGQSDIARELGLSRQTVIRRLDMAVSVWRKLATNDQR
jgi:RNA polymerase sigma factor (sigma-70 family)